jgi:hypothetical protein
MIVNPTGRVGINTSPAEALHVHGNVLASGTITASNLVILGDYVTLDTITSNTEQMVITNDGTGPALIVTQTGPQPIADFYDDGSALALRIADGGNVGIGTKTPLQKLHVNGAVQASSFIGTGSSITSLDVNNVTSGLLAVARGGTNNASYAVGDILYASGTTALSRLADIVIGNALISGGVGIAPIWGKIGLTSHVSGVLGVSNGGTGASTLTANKLLVGNGTTTVLQPTDLHWDNTNSRLGIGIASPSEKLTVGGNLYLDSAAAVLYVGNNANGAVGGTIYFGGTYGDNAHNHAVIESRVYETSTEKSELLLFKGNDSLGAAGPDRIRLRGNEIILDTYSSATTDRVAENVRMVVKQDGKVGIGTTLAHALLHVQGDLYVDGGFKPQDNLPFNKPTYFWEGVTTFTTSTEPLSRIVVVGGATINSTSHTTNPWNGMNMFALDYATSPAVGTAPTAYMHIKIPITKITHYAFFMQVITYDRWSCPEVWVCNASTKVPTVRIQGKSNNYNDATTGSSSLCSFMGPYNIMGKLRTAHEWIQYSIPESVITSYKDANSDIYIGVCRAIGNGGDSIWISGLAMAPNPFGVGTVGCVECHNGWQQNGGTGGPPYYGPWSLEGMGYLLASTTYYVRIPITDSTKDLLISYISWNYHNMEGVPIWLILSGVTYYFSQTCVGRYWKGAGFGNYRSILGTIVPSSVVTSNIITVAGRQFINCAFINRDITYRCYFRGFVVENVS